MWPPKEHSSRQSNKEHMRLWVAALRSGDFMQTTGTLAIQLDENEWGYCCLGVACEVAMAHGVPLDVEIKPNKTVTYDRSTSILPVQACEFFGLEYGDPMITQHYEASAANDQQGWTFNQIADAIEEWYELNDDSEHDGK